MLNRLARGVVVFVCACGDVKPNKLADAPLAPDSPPAIDAPMADAPPPRCDPSKAFATATPVTELNSGMDDFTPSLSADELTVVFASTRVGGSGLTDIYIATRATRTAPFGAPALLAGVNTTGNDSRPIITADGLALYLEHLPNPNSAWDVMKATRTSTSGQFGTPTQVVAIDTTSNEVAPFVLPDQSAIYFVSNRGGNNDIWTASGTNGAFGAPALASGMNLSGTPTEDYPTLTPDQLTMYFASDRPGGVGQGTDIWVAKRTSLVTGFGTPTNVTELNTGGPDSPGWISADGCVLYFNRNIGVAASNYQIMIAAKPL
ncbi:MAG: PD40 domain-containing protein [Deltaproteobacteria bacterium]|nr:PD40 domain-containing protein [Deltaproteobacteria bacterium]